MQPFLKHTKEGSASGPTDTLVRDPLSDFDMLEAAALDLISAVHQKDVKAACQALRAAFQICDLEPHSEGEPK